MDPLTTSPILALKKIRIEAEIDLVDFDIRKELVVGSDCFGGWRTKIEFIGKVESNFTITKEVLFDAFKKLKDEAKVWEETGGTHIAGSGLWR